MVENIYMLKNKILAHVEEQTNDMARMNVKEVGELVDMVKDLAEAEKSCWEASYYKSVTEAMDQTSGYGSQSMRQGYGSQGMRQGYGSMGHGDVVEMLGEEFRKLSPEERMTMKSKVLNTLGQIR